jgi:hypothetical protein
MLMISVFNLCTVLTDDVVSNAVGDLQTQVDRDFAPLWYVGAKLEFCRKNGPPPRAGSWWLVILDDADQANAVGYHDVTPQGLPLGKVFAKTDAESGHTWTITSSHELLEMLADPWMNRCCLGLIGGNQKVLAYEVCDPCEDDGFSYKIGPTSVSDFVTPAWFEENSTAVQFDFCGFVKRPLQILPGGYIGAYDGTDGWSQIHVPNVSKQFEAGMVIPRQSSIPLGSRRDKRLRKSLGLPLLKSGEPIRIADTFEFAATCCTF